MRAETPAKQVIRARLGIHLLMMRWRTNWINCIPKAMGWPHRILKKLKLEMMRSKPHGTIKNVRCSNTAKNKPKQPTIYLMKPVHKGSRSLRLTDGADLRENMQQVSSMPAMQWPVCHRRCSLDWRKVSRVIKCLRMKFYLDQKSSMRHLHNSNKDYPKSLSKKPSGWRGPKPWSPSMACHSRS